MTYSKGPWIYDAESGEIHTKDRTGFWGPDHEPVVVATVAPLDGVDNGPLLAASAELLEALRDAVDLAWTDDSHTVRFDSTVLFGPYYEFKNLERCSRQEFLAKYDCVVWPGNKWSAYCTYEGSMWFEKFDSAEEAKEACMRLLDRVLPEHPAMKARAAIAKATGEAK